MVRKITVEECTQAANKVAGEILDALPLSSLHPLQVYGVPRGGIPAAAMVCAEYNAKSRVSPGAYLCNSPEDADVIVDDLEDSGATARRYRSRYGKPFFSLFQKRVEDGWFLFPWDVTVEGSASDIVVRLLQFIGEDPSRGGLLETPARVLKAWQHWTTGYTETPADVLKVFEDGGERYDEMVLVKDIPVYSHCEHHLAPFFGVAHVGYIPNGRIVGLSKLSRLVDVFARRLQVQERLTNQVAHSLMDDLGAKGAGVVLECRHLCMESRGIQRQGSTTTTSSMLGILRDDASARAEFTRLLR